MSEINPKTPGWILVLDSATSRVVVAAGSGDGRLIAERSFPAEHRHGERLLATVEELAKSEGLELEALGGIVVGTGPGAFTGLRVGLATAKTLAHELHVPIAGVSTGDALVRAAGGATSVWLPAGPQDRVEIAPDGGPRLVNAAVARETSGDASVVAIDLDGRAAREALERGRHAADGLAVALLALGLARLEAGGDDPETLVPDYVTLPRGVTQSLDLEGGVAWSHDRR
jgi:tRNA threonylcarbamoyl adenosine modification protein YeaZ